MLKGKGRNVVISSSMEGGRRRRKKRLRDVEFKNTGRESAVKGVSVIGDKARV